MQLCIFVRLSVLSLTEPYHVGSFHLQCLRLCFEVQRGDKEEKFILQSKMHIFHVEKENGKRMG